MCNTQAGMHPLLKGMTSDKGDVEEETAKLVLMAGLRTQKPPLLATLDNRENDLEFLNPGQRVAALHMEVSEQWVASGTKPPWSSTATINVQCGKEEDYGGRVVAMDKDTRMATVVVVYYENNKMRGRQGGVTRLRKERTVVCSADMLLDARFAQTQPLPQFVRRRCPRIVPCVNAHFRFGAWFYF